MIATELLADLTRLGIRLEAHGDRLQFWPRSAVTPDMGARIKTHKEELLTILRQEPPGTRADSKNKPATDLGKCSGCGAALVETPTFDGFLNLACTDCDRCFSCRPANEKVAERFRRNKELGR